MILQLPITVVEEGNIYVVTCPVFHLTSKGDTLVNALENIKADLETFLDNKEVQKEYHDTMNDYSKNDLEIIDVVVKMK